MSEDFSPILAQRSDGVTTITLNRPERLNAIDGALIRGLHDAMGEAMACDRTRAVILTGAGERAFCAGDDLKAPRLRDPDDVRRQVAQVQDITRQILYGPKPVIAAVNGWAVGGGLEWVMNCDVAVWADTARAFFPEASLGLGVTGAATAILPQIIGAPRARALMLLGDRLDARQMLALGLAYEVTTPDALMNRARVLARRLAEMPVASVAGLKRVAALVQREAVEAALKAEAELLEQLLLDDTIEAHLAEFRGRPS